MTVTGVNPSMWGHVVYPDFDPVISRPISEYPIIILAWVNAEL
jgi:hypothetical protein